MKITKQRHRENKEVITNKHGGIRKMDFIEWIGHVAFKYPEIDKTSDSNGAWRDIWLRRSGNQSPKKRKTEQNEFIG